VVELQQLAADFAPRAYSSFGDLLQPYLVFYNHFQAGLGDRYGSRGLQLFIAGEIALGDRLPYGRLDIALRSDSDLLQELPDAHVEGIFVHEMLLSMGAHPL
jgi:hypothetical protein